MNIVIDTNILISYLIKPHGVVGSTLMQLPQFHSLYTTDELIVEIEKHNAKVQKLSGLDVFKFELLKQQALRLLHVIPTDLIDNKSRHQAYELVKDADINDVKFVAATLFCEGVLWTGDKPLYSALRKHAFPVLNTKEIRQLI